ncbi:hypothetical protein L596_007012 [Steinernema carpocapsae]|uniref:Uncharacterized protein n=1 Tax=Steinernema carpocapsae TaxID=34508 RepID=A0A4U5P7V2_STECR|nr:hypothetical protein L596_007012 [Steinernema carpocapsae]
MSLGRDAVACRYEIDSKRVFVEKATSRNSNNSRYVSNLRPLGRHLLQRTICSSRLQRSLNIVSPGSPRM